MSVAGLGRVLFLDVVCSLGGSLLYYSVMELITFLLGLVIVQWLFLFTLVVGY